MLFPKTSLNRKFTVPTDNLLLVFLFWKTSIDTSFTAASTKGWCLSKSKTSIRRKQFMIDYSCLLDSRNLFLWIKEYLKILNNKLLLKKIMSYQLFAPQLFAFLTSWFDDFFSLIFFWLTFDFCTPWKTILRHLFHIFTVII